MSAFHKEYTLKINKSLNDTVEIFRNNLDDMTKKGYSLSGNSIIMNSDHHGKYFSGECKGDNVFAVRQTEDSSDIYYRYLPRHIISFTGDDFSTDVSVKSEHPRLRFIFILVSVLSAIIICLAVYLAYSMSLTFLIMLIIPVACLTIILVFSNSKINDTKVTLEYIFR